MQMQVRVTWMVLNMPSTPCRPAARWHAAGGVRAAKGSHALLLLSLVMLLDAAPIEGAHRPRQSKASGAVAECAGGLL